MNEKKSEKATRWISTGVQALDNIMGGYPKRAVSLFWGGTGSCKTTLASYIPIIRTFDEKKKNQVFFIVDSEGGFDWDRLIQMLEANNLPVDEVIQRVLLFEPTTFGEQQFMVEGLLKFDEEGEGVLRGWGPEIPKNAEPSLLAIDSVVWLAKIEYQKKPPNIRAGSTPDYVNDIGIQCLQARRFAVKHDCIATVTSWDISTMGSALGGSSEYPFVGGRNLAFIPKLNVELINPESEFEELQEYENWQDIRVARVWKHRSKGRLRVAFFLVTDSGIMDIKPPESKKVIS